jgi:hypothetical protein
MNFFKNDASSGKNQTFSAGVFHLLATCLQMSSCRNIFALTGYKHY